MAKLTRFTMPVFAGSAAQDQTSVFGTMKTSPQYTSDVAASIDTTAYSNGWTDAVELGYAPFLEDNNTIHKAITYQIAYGQQQGIPEWASDTEYYIGSLAKLNTATGSEVYSSLVDNNVGNLLSDTTKWKKVFDSNLQTQINTKANTTDVVNLTGTQTISGAKTLQTAYIQSTTVEYNVAPAENHFKWLRWIDKNGEVMGVVEVSRTTSNATHMQLNVRGANGNYAEPALGIVMEANGDIWAQAPQGGHYDDSIVTTVQYVSNSAGEAWVLGNGLTIQKGVSSVDNNQVTLPTPFKSTNYVVCATYHKIGSHGSGIGHICTYNNYTNSFFADTEGGEYQWIAIGY